MNVELCILNVGSIKCLFKYVRKGSDRAIVEIKAIQGKNGSQKTSKKLPTVDEIHQYQYTRYFSASEGAWRLFSIPTVEHHPIMERSEAHLEGCQIVKFEEVQHEKAAEKGKEKSTKLIASFHANEQIPNARHILYFDFAKYFCRIRKVEFGR